MNNSNKQFIVRPYYGHDCNSQDGFNNGYYLDEIEVQAENEYEAIEIAQREFCKENEINFDSLNSIPADRGAWHFDYMGEEYLYREFDHQGEDDDQTYLYQYIDFTDVTEVTEELTNETA